MCNLFRPHFGMREGHAVAASAVPGSRSPNTVEPVGPHFGMREGHAVAASAVLNGLLLLTVPSLTA